MREDSNSESDIPLAVIRNDNYNDYDSIDDTDEDETFKPKSNMYNSSDSEKSSTDSDIDSDDETYELEKSKQTTNKPRNSHELLKRTIGGMHVKKETCIEKKNCKERIVNLGTILILMSMKMQFNRV